MSNTILIIAHSGLDKRITQEECETQIALSSGQRTIFVELNVCEAKLSELYDLPFGQLALEQERKFKSEIEPMLKENPDATIAYFGMVPIPLAIHLGYLCGSTRKYEFYHKHHMSGDWSLNHKDIGNSDFEISPIELPVKVEKGKGEVFVRVCTSYRIEPQHTYEVHMNPTNEFDLLLTKPNVDASNNQFRINSILDSFQKIINGYSDFLPDRDKVHLFVATTPAIAFGIGTKINPNVVPYVQTYQYSKSETPKYREAILISRESDDIIAYTDEEISKANELRNSWASELDKRVSAFIKRNNNSFEDWFSHVSHNSSKSKQLLTGLWKSLPQLSSTSLVNDTIDLESNVVEDGFTYDNVNLKWKIDDGMFVSLNKRLSKVEGADILQAGRLFLFHEGLHYCPEGHRLIDSVADGIGQFPKVIEEADYQADVYALLYEYRYCIERDSDIENLKKFFSDAIKTATETMWSFIDSGDDLSEIQVRSMNRFLNWYWQSVRIEQLEGSGSLEDIVEILFDKPVIEVAGPPPFILDRRRVAIKLNSTSTQRFEIAIFHKNRIVRTSPIGIDLLISGLRELDGEKIKSGLRGFYASFNI